MPKIILEHDGRTFFKTVKTTDLGGGIVVHSTRHHETVNIYSTK